MRKVCVGAHPVDMAGMSWLFSRSWIRPKHPNGEIYCNVSLPCCLLAGVASSINILDETCRTRLYRRIITEQAAGCKTVSLKICG
jgi:hypothetical protein